MGDIIDRDSLHRTAKYFMDTGKAATHDDAAALLHGFGLTIHVGQEVAGRAAHQTALLTLVNVARRTLLGGVEVTGLADAPALTPLAKGQSLRQAVHELGGRVVEDARAGWPSAVIGNVEVPRTEMPCWRLAWKGWRGGVVTARDAIRLEDDDAFVLSPALAAGVCAAEIFAYHAGDHPMAGRRDAGMSLWRPGSNWLGEDHSEPSLHYLPSRLWLIGLGNLGQAFAWLLACLPYPDRSRVCMVLQDFDKIAASNDSTSILSFIKDIRRKKTRVVAEWLEARGFDVHLEERKFGKWTRRTEEEPGVALCGVDNANARAELEKAGFGLIVEAGLGAGPQGFRNISMHTFPASRSAEDIWSKQVGMHSENFEDMPAYEALKRSGMDRCGLTQLALRTVGVPFVGLIAACLVISELLRRLNGGIALELASVSAMAMEDIEAVAMQASVYEFGHLAVG